MTDPTVVEISSSSNSYYNNTDSVVLTVEAGVVLNSIEDYGYNTSLVNRGTISGTGYYSYAHFSSSTSTVTNAVSGIINNSASLGFGSNGSFNISNYGSIQGDINGYGSGISTVHNYGSFTGALFGSSGATLDLFTGSSNGTISASHSSGTATVNLLLDDRPAIAANSDAGANSGVTSGTVHDLSNFGTLNVQGGSWTLGSNENFTTGVVMASGAGLDVTGHTLTTGTLTLTSGAVVHDTAGSTGGFAASGQINLAGATLDLESAGTVPAVNSVMTLVNNTGTGAVQGIFAGLSDGATINVGGHVYQISYHGGDGNDVTLTRLVDPSTYHSAVGYDLSSLTPGQQSSFTAANALQIPGQADDVTVTPSATGVILTFGGESYTFADGTLSQASQAQQVDFANGETLLIGANGGNDTIVALDSLAHVAYGLGGDDHLIFGDGNDVLNGGLGNDQITAGNGNNHIWGNATGSTQGQADGADTITAGSGSNYINGNAGDDVIVVGTVGSTGANRIYGGAGQDTITIHGAGTNYANGNLGNDTINASDATGNNLLRGGQGDDVIRGGHGQDQLLGDIGNDVLVAGSGIGHLSVMTGGQGNDTFDFSHNAQGSTAVAGTTYYQEVTDFTHASDHIGLSFTVGANDVLTASNNFTDVASAQAYAQQLLAGHGDTTGVAALQVGGNTYLFYDAAGTSTTIDSIVQLDHVTSTTLGSSDFSLIAA